MHYFLYVYVHIYIYICACNTYTLVQGKAAECVVAVVGFSYTEINNKQIIFNIF